jgi:hypothetical protein
MRVKSRPDRSCGKIRLLPREERYGAIGPEAITVIKPSSMKLSLSNSSPIWPCRMSQGQRATEYSRSGIERLFAAKCSSGWILDSSEELDTAPMLAL